MSETSQEPQGAGARIAAARRQRGMALDVLATQLKVPAARLEALERERWDELPDPTHARALATSVCRALDLDPAPVLAAMPRGAGAALDRVTQGLNQPVRSGSGLGLPKGILAALLLLGLAAALLLAWPTLSAWLPQPAEPAVEQVATAPVVTSVEPVAVPLPAVAASVAPSTAASEAAAPTLTPAAASAPNPQPSPVTAPVAPAATAALLEIHARDGASWVSVADASGASLAAQLLNPGERLSLNPPAALPLRVVLGNAPVLELRWRGQAQALEGYEQRRVAKLELK